MCRFPWHVIGVSGGRHRIPVAEPVTEAGAPVESVGRLAGCGRRWARRRIAARVPCGARLLEIAPGPGYLAIELARRGLAVSAVDIVSFAVEIPSSGHVILLGSQDVGSIA
jgi:hypothetical protein